MPEREQLLAIRNHLMEHHEEFRRLSKGRNLKLLMSDFDGLRLSRPPKGFPKDHPAMDLIACRQWGVSTSLPAERALKPTLRKEIVSRFRAAAPLIEFLNGPLTAQFKPSHRIDFF